MNQTSMLSSKYSGRSGGNGVGGVRRAGGAKVVAWRRAEKGNEDFGGWFEKEKKG